MPEDTPMSNSFETKASAYDKNTLNKLEIDKAIGLLKDFRAKYPLDNYAVA
jgi:hypothetical protein